MTSTHPNIRGVKQQRACAVRVIFDDDVSIEALGPRDAPRAPHTPTFTPWVMKLHQLDGQTEHCVAAI